MASGRLRGTLTTWNDDRGFGFIAPELRGENVFVHISAFPVGASRPSVGDGVSYELSARTDGSAQARRVRPSDWSETRLAASTGRLDYLAILGFLPIAAIAALLWTAPWLIFAIYLAMSLLAFLLYRADKIAAGTGGWRTPEATLLLVGLVGGWPGAITAMQVLRHKTRKTSFRRAFWITVALNVVLFVFITSPLFRDGVAWVLMRFS